MSVQMIEDFQNRYPDVRYVDVIFADISGMLRGKRFPWQLFSGLRQRGANFPGSTFLLDCTGEPLNPNGLGFSDGDPDQVGRMVDGTLSIVPWSNGANAQVIATFADGQERPYIHEPRNVLVRMASNLKALGFEVTAAFELEFYLLEDRPGSDGASSPRAACAYRMETKENELFNLDELDAEAGLFEDIRHFCDIQGIPLGAFSSELGPQQFEINLLHEPDVVVAADHCVLFKRTVKAAAARRGFNATFMAKPRLDAAGSGLHLHISLRDVKGHSVFDRPDGSKDLLRHAVGGLLASMPEAMAIFAPNENSYRRFKAGTFVPLGPTWGRDNRSVAVRLPAARLGASRLEHRIAGADANPYLAMAAALAGMHYGISNTVEPPEETTSLASQTHHPGVPFQLFDALSVLRNGEILNKSFGREYVSTYVACKEAEYMKLHGTISQKEYDWFVRL